MSRSFANGLYGGSIGGGLSGLIIGVTYYLGAHAAEADSKVVWTTAILLTFVYASLVGAVVGAFTQFVIRLFRYLRDDKRYPGMIFNEIVAGVVGGLAAGAILGVIGVVIFAEEPGPKLSTGLLVLVPGLVGAIPLVLGIALYEYRGRWRSLVPSLVTLIIAAPPIAGLTTFLFWVEKIDLSQATIPDGILAGLDVGLMLGSLVGLVLFVNRSWNAAGVSPST